MGGSSSGSAPTGSGPVTPVEVSAAGDGTGALSITGTVSSASVSGPRAGSGPEANRRTEKGRSATPGSVSLPGPANGAAPARRRQAPGSLFSEISAAGRYTSAVVPPSGGVLSVTVMPYGAARSATAGKR